MFDKIWEERYFKFVRLQLYKQVRKNSSAMFSYTQCVRIAHTIPFPFLNILPFTDLCHVLRNSGNTPERWDCNFPV